MTIHCKASEVQTFEEVKQQNEQYWKIIEKQRVIIQTLQKSLTNLTNENEYLIKKNRELEGSAPVIPVTDSVGVTIENPRPTTIETTSNTTPVPPPRSPYRVHQGHNQHPHDIVSSIKQNNTTHTLTDMPKRPPFLKLAKSNHSPLYSRAMKDVNTTELWNKESQISPGKNMSNPSSPLSVTSAGSSSIDNRPSFESIENTYTASVQNTPRRTSTSPKFSPMSNSEKDYHRNNVPAQKYEKNILGINNINHSEPSTPIKPRTPRFDSLMARNDCNETPPTTLSYLSNIRIQVISSSLATDEKGKEYPVFVIGIHDELNHEIWKIQKTLSNIFYLDVQLKNGNTALKKLPDRSPFTTYTPVKMEEIKIVIEEYLQNAIALKAVDVRALCEFLSSDRIHTEENDIGLKQGYLTKRGKNFGGWKTRYFALEDDGILKYFESKGGNYLGRIKLLNAQIRRQTAQEDYESSYRNAFMILESKSNGSYHRHIFCANSDQDRDSWVESLKHYTNQAHSAVDVSNSSSFSEDNMLIDQLVIEPSSSTESARTAPIIGKRPSMDYIYTYFTQNGNSGAHRRSLSKDAASLKDDMNHGDSIMDETSKKSKHRASKRTFWGKKMFGSNGSTSDMASPTSTQGVAIGSSYDLKYIQAISDYEETRGNSQVFGIPLESAVLVARVCDQYELPAIVHRCIEYMEARNALNEEGIYRLSGSASSIKRLKKRFNDDGDVRLLDDEEYHDVHAIAGLLKMWLRELPENIFTDALLSDFLQTIELIDRQTRVSEVGRLVSSLPLVNYTLLRSLCAHLIRVIGKSELNKMSLRNISIVFSATLGIPSSIFNLLLVDFDYIFWTNRCAKDQTVPATEDTIQHYLENESVGEEDVDDITRSYQHPSVSSLKLSEGAARSKRNSAHYQTSTPKDFISLENQLNAVINDIPTPYDDEPYCSDEELEMAYFASRYTANSKTPSVY